MADKCIFILTWYEVKEEREKEKNRRNLEKMRTNVENWTWEGDSRTRQGGYTNSAGVDEWVRR